MAQKPTVQTKPLATSVPGMGVMAPDAENKKLSKKLAGLIKRGKKRRRPWEKHWADVYDYCFPFREAWHEDQEDGASRTDLIYDNTAVEAIPKFASRLVHGLFPPASDAFKLDAGVDVNEIDRTSPTLRAELDLIVKAWHSWLRNSNFESEINEAAQDLGIGTATLLMEPGTFAGELMFTAVPPNSLLLLPGVRDTVSVWMYERKMRIEEIRATWPKAVLSRRMIEAEKSNPDKEVKLWDITERDQEKLEGEVSTRWLWCEEYDHTLQTIDYKGRGSCPWITFRWSKTANEVWGRGPILNVLPSVKTVNLTVQLVLENAEMSIAGLYAYDDDGVFNPDNIRVEPGMFIPKSPGGSIEALQSPARFDVSSMILSDERAAIRRGLYVDELERDGKTPYSAEEVQARRADMARNMGSVSGRVWHELVLAMVDRLRYLGEYWNMLKMPVIDGKKIKLVPLSPLLRIQDQSDISNLVQYTQVLNGTMGPGSSAMVLNQERTQTWLAAKFGLDATLLNSITEQKRLAQGVQNQAAQIPGGPEELMKTAVKSGLSVV